jgi:hypothetical protein
MAAGSGDPWQFHRRGVQWFTHTGYFEDKGDKKE